MTAEAPVRKLSCLLSESAGIGWVVVKPSYGPRGAYLMNRIVEAPPRGRHLVPWASTIALPHEIDVFCSGKRMQALRTNCRRATSRGMTAGQCSSGEASTAITSLMQPGRYWWADSSAEVIAGGLHGGTVSPFVCRSPQGQLLSLAIVVFDLPVAWVQFSVSERSADGSDARYLLHRHLVSEAINRGATWMLTHGMKGASPSQRYLLSRLGYEPRHLVAIPPRLLPLPAAAWAYAGRFPERRRTASEQG